MLEETAICATDDPGYYAFPCIGYTLVTFTALHDYCHERDVAYPTMDDGAGNKLWIFFPMLPLKSMIGCMIHGRRMGEELDDDAAQGESSDRSARPGGQNPVLFRQTSKVRGVVKKKL